MQNKNLALNAIFKFAAKSFRLQQCCVLFSIVVVGSELREQKQAIKFKVDPISTMISSSAVYPIAICCWL